MTDDERAAADLLLAGLYAQNPWLTTLTERASVETGKAPGADARGRRFAEARPVRPPAAARTAVDAALAEAVSGAERPATRAAPSAAAPAAVRAAVSTSGRPVSRPARGGSGQAVDAALAQALGSRPAQVEVASLAPVRKPIRSSSSAAPAPQTDAEAEAVAAAAAAALRTAPPAAPLAPPVVAAIPSPPDAAQRASDEALQRQAEERAREHARAEAAARAQAEANARAQAAAEERAAIAARGSYRPPENDDEPDIAQTPADGRTSADVARHATARGFEANKTQVIGVIGAGRASRGLIRLRSGKVVTVRIGDRIDGGAINKIGDGKISYVKGGRTYNLPIMNGR